VFLKNKKLIKTTNIESIDKKSMNKNNNYTNGFIEISSGKIHFLEWGQDSPGLHFLHANGFCSGVYEPLLKYMDDRFHIIASDARGHGDSDPIGLDKISAWEIFAHDLKEFLESKTELPVTGMGHSFGAVVTLIAAARFPHLFDRIVLIDPVILTPGLLKIIKILRFSGQEERFPLAQGARRRKNQFSSREEAYNRFASGRGLFKTWKEEFINAYLNCAIHEADDGTAFLKCNPETEAQIFQSVPAHIWSYAGKVDCPVLVIRGENSDTFVEKAAKKLNKSVKNIRIVNVKNSGHFVPMEEPSIVAELILDFITKK